MTVEVPHLDPNDTFGDKAIQEIYQDAVWCFDKIREALTTKLQSNGHLLSISQERCARLAGN